MCSTVRSCTHIQGVLRAHSLVATGVVGRRSEGRSGKNQSEEPAPSRLLATSWYRFMSALQSTHRARLPDEVDEARELPRVRPDVYVPRARGLLVGRVIRAESCAWEASEGSYGAEGQNEASMGLFKG